MINERIRKRRNELNLSQEYMAKQLGITRQGYGHYETGRNEPDINTLKRISDILDCSIDYLYGNTDNPNPPGELPALTEKDEKDIAKDLEKIINNLSTDGYAHFDGRSIEELDEEDKELLIASLENSMRLAKRIAKDKFTPKKYKK